MNRRGFSLVELSVTLVLGIAVMASVAPAFMLVSRGMEQQSVGEEVQGAIHQATLQLMRGVQGATAVAEGSTDVQLLLEGGALAVACGGSPYWIGEEDGSLACGPEGQDVRRRLAGAIESVEFEYGVDTTGDGTVDAFHASVPAGESDDVIGVRFSLGFAGVEGRGRATADIQFVVVLRNQVLSRIDLPL